MPIECLVLPSCRDVLIHRQVREKRAHGFCVQLARVNSADMSLSSMPRVEIFVRVKGACTEDWLAKCLFAVTENVPFDPRAVSLLSTQTEVAKAGDIAHLISNFFSAMWGSRV
jgi:hypothetical protein